MKFWKNTQRVLTSEFWLKITQLATQTLSKNFLDSQLNLLSAAHPVFRTKDGHHFVMERLGAISPDLAGLFPLEVSKRASCCSTYSRLPPALPVLT